MFRKRTSIRRSSTVPASLVRVNKNALWSFLTHLVALWANTVIMVFPSTFPTFGAGAMLVVAPPASPTMGALAIIVVIPTQFLANRANTVIIVLTPKFHFPRVSHGSPLATRVLLGPIGRTKICRAF